MKRLILTMVLATSLVACSATTEDVVATSYKSMQTTATLAAAVLSAATDLYEQGLLQEDAYTQVLTAAQTFYDTYTASVDILYSYAENQDTTGKEKILAQLDLLKSSVAVLLTLAGGVGVDLSDVDTSILDDTTTDTTTEETTTDTGTEAPATADAA